LPKAYRQVAFEGNVETVKIIGVEYVDGVVDVLQIMVHPMTDDEFYSELYMEDYGTWTFVEEEV